MGCVLIKLFSFRQPKDIQRRNAAIISIGLTSFIIYHCVTDEFTLHIIIFLSLTFTVIWKTRKIIRETVQDSAQRKKMATLATFGTSTAFFAYFLWNIDVHCCSTVTRLQHRLGYPLGVLLELHGWWHILTALSSYTMIAMIEFLTCEGLDDSHGVGFLWPARAVLEDAAQAQFMNGNGHTKGS
ncbi:uncharacterized protein LTR77_000265 [Saxophila tyrrhenica]|uniref:Alkaline ceramidase n=1 Tax=Saxophila tyrrhenica TaxID=1690608 RepID=A0AAV9PPB6_9PEZI|nr:hypothetical protein LTR77_000265 [Saxophila tyrrhenica]